MEPYDALHQPIRARAGSNKSQLPKFKNPNKRSVYHFAQRHHPRLTRAYEAVRYNCGECFGHWRLKFEIYLEFGAWDLRFYFLLKPYSCIYYKICFDATLMLYLLDDSLADAV
jgi:hypothetical protein